MWYNRTMNYDKNTFDFVKLFSYLSLVLAVVFYILSVKIQSAFLPLYVIGVLFLISGIVFIIIRVYRKFSIGHSFYVKLVDKKRKEIYSVCNDVLETRNELKRYKKQNLRSYRFDNVKYIGLMLFLGVIASYLLYLVVCMIFIK